MGPIGNVLVGVELCVSRRKPDPIRASSISGIAMPMSQRWWLKLRNAGIGRKSKRIKIATKEA